MAELKAFAARALSATFCAASLAGCQQEMLKATPFAAGEYALATGPVEERLNLWPLLYHRAPATSFLWPIGEKTDTTWAVRPIIARYDGKLDLLWPFVHVDFEKSSGYIVPLLAWSPERFGLFPLFSAGWGRQGEFIITPLFGWGTRATGEQSGGWLYTPLYSRIDAGEERTHIVPPIFTWWKTGGADGGWSGAFLFPLASMVRRPELSMEHLFPFYGRWEERRSGQTSRGLVLFPFYIGHDRLQEGERRSTARVLPLLLSGWGGSEDGRLLVVFPFYVGYEGKDNLGREKRTHFLPFLLSGRESWADGPRAWYVLFPLAAWGATPEHSFSQILPIYVYHQSRADGTTDLILPFLLYGSMSGPKGGGWTVIPFCSYSWDEPSGWSASILFALGGMERTAQRDFEYLFPIFSRSFERRPPAAPAPAGKEGGPGAAGGAGRTEAGVEEKAAAAAGPAEAAAGVAPPAPPAPAAPETVPEWEARFHILFILFDSLSRPLPEGGEYRRRRVLWRLWHDETVGERRAIDVFPFITYDRDGEQSLTWSWFYALLRYERRGADRSLNLFFLPAIRWRSGEE